MRYPRALSASLPFALALASACAEPSAPDENAPPTVTLLSPAVGSTFSGGDDLAVEIEGSDAEDGTLAGASLSWWAILHHATHTHPFLPETSGASGTASIPRFGHVETDIFYRIYARAVDSEGLADTAFVDVSPRLVTLSFATEPAGLEVTVDGQPRVTPVDLESVVGIERELVAPSPQTSGGTSYGFVSWSQGGDAAQTLITPATDVVLIATFTELGVANVPPTVAITAPADGATVTEGAPVTITADAADADGTVAEVAFLDGVSVLGTDDTEPYSIEWTPTGTGAHTLTARATDDEGATTTSAEVGVTVQAAGPGDVTAPVATLTSPAHGSLGLTGAVALAADATDDVGVTQVDFQVDGETIGTDDTEPYGALLAATADYTTGAHTVRARARDAAGNWSPWSSATVTFGGNVSLPAGFTRTAWATGFDGSFPNALTAAAFTPDGRLLVLELQGRIHVVENGVRLATPFAELDVVIGGELGLTGIALDPDFDTNGYLYLYYTTDAGGTTHTRISRFTAAGNVVAPGSEVVLVDLDDLAGATFHVGGALAFGPDGKLYVGVGDSTRPQMAPSLTTRFGKILRYNPDGTIPADNPLIGSTSGPYQAIWAYGLRNPFTIGFDPVTGRMHVNDVGQDTWEEIDLGVAGANYGWPATEGPTSNPAYVAPLLAYRHSGSPTLFDGSSVVGAAFYGPASNAFGAAYQGDYFFADYVEGWIYRMDSDLWDTAYAFARIEQGITNLVVGADGALYVLVGSRVDRIAR